MNHVNFIYSLYKVVDNVCHWLQAQYQKEAEQHRRRIRILTHNKQVAEIALLLGNLNDRNMMLDVPRTMPLDVISVSALHSIKQG